MVKRENMFSEWKKRKHGCSMEKMKTCLANGKKIKHFWSME
jgi:hypothetical protein